MTQTTYTSIASLANINNGKFSYLTVKVFQTETSLNLIIQIVRIVQIKPKTVYNCYGIS